MWSKRDKSCGFRKGFKRPIQQDNQWKINQTIQLDGRSEMLPLHFCPWPRLIGSCFLSQSLWLAVSLEMLEEMVGGWQKTEVGNAQGPVPWNIVATACGGVPRCLPLSSRCHPQEFHPLWSVLVFVKGKKESDRNNFATLASTMLNFPSTNYWKLTIQMIK